ncbi:hypothetical protein G9A89_004566 [Geosiphon pyriformis]|nr:hypothetical protein G9A89_004566 [Geosiphon pyriformis]
MASSSLPPNYDPSAASARLEERRGLLACFHLYFAHQVSLGLSTSLIFDISKWRITDRRIEYTAGFCGSEESTLDVRRITDLQFQRSLFQLLLGRGTFIIYSADNTDPKLEISTWGMKQVYYELKESWLGQRKVPAAIIEYEHSPY